MFIHVDGNFYNLNRVDFITTRQEGDDPVMVYEDGSRFVLDGGHGDRFIEELESSSLVVNTPTNE